MDIDIETHPWPPFAPPGAKILIMGTFPPGAHRWSMDFYYPNRTNDFWYMMGLIFYGDPRALCMPDSKEFDLPRIKQLLTERGIALNDTGYRIRRLKGNASDKFLEIVEPVHLRELLAKLPDCHTLATTGEKAAGVIAELTSTPAPKMGECVESADGLTIWRMPSTSRAYPLALAKKAEYYGKMFRQAGILK
ncbi:MAG: uracil-DNA glycosylase family protein [Bacteroidales bacterium]|nr:uracil-DNA glycosylase family protein [Bacteroidales bacterium]